MIEDKNNLLMEKYLLQQMDNDGRSRHKMELKNLLHSQETRDITIGSSLLEEIRQAAFSQPPISNNEDLPVSKDTIKDFLNSPD